VILLLDIGNTRIKWAQLLDGALTPQQSLTHRGVDPAVWMKQLFRERFRPERLLVANVAGADMRSRISGEAERLWQVKAEFARTASFAAGVTHAYADVSAHGVDRWLAALAAYRLAGGATCVIDVGTAVTMDGVNAEGLHLGGLIIPGMQMMIEALLDRTSDIARQARKLAAVGGAEAVRQNAALATSTAQAVASGALLAVAAAADRAIGEVKLQTRVTPKVFLTGGDAERVQKAMQTQAEHVPDLVLRGLAILAQQRAAP
jgi:type III pantothenate kinase